jgi:hypothetical protein
LGALGVEIAPPPLGAVARTPMTDAEDPRNTKLDLIEDADRVTEFALVKHRFAVGVRTREGVAF